MARTLNKAAERMVMRMARRFVPRPAKSKQGRRQRLPTSAPDLLQLMCFRRSIPACGGRLQDNRLVLIDHRGVAPLQPLNSSVSPPHRVFTNLAGLAARKTKRAHPAVSGQNRTFHLFHETDGAPDAVTGVPFAAPAGTGANMEIFKHDGVTKLQHLRIGEACVCNVSVNRIGAVEAGACGEPEQ